MESRESDVSMKTNARNDAMMIEAITLYDIAKSQSFEQIYEEQIRSLINEKGANPNLLSCVSPHKKLIKIARILLECGADINGKNFVPEPQHNNFLHYAIEKCDLNLIRFALENGADIHRTNNRLQKPLLALDHQIRINNPEEYCNASLYINDIYNYGQTQKRYKQFCEQKPTIINLFLPYIFNQNDKEAFFYISLRGTFGEIEIEKVTNDGIRNCMAWTEELLSHTKSQNTEKPPFIQRSLDLCAQLKKMSPNRFLRNTVNICNAYYGEAEKDKLNYLQFLEPGLMLFILCELGKGTVGMSHVEIEMCSLLVLQNFERRRSMITNHQYYPNFIPDISGWWKQSIFYKGSNKKLFGNREESDKNKKEVKYLK